jgi:PPOX class probable F420-dependent enzyme
LERSQEEEVEVIMKGMSQQEMAVFLGAPRHAIVGTNAVDGPPQLSPVWYVFDNGRFYISIGTNTAKYHNLQRDPRISVCVDGGYPDFRTVMASGEAQLLPPGDPLQTEMRWRIIRQYHETEEAARKYMERVRDSDAALIVVMPEKVICQDFG